MLVSRGYVNCQAAVDAGAGLRVVGPQLPEQLHGGEGEEEGVAVAEVRGSGESLRHGGEPVRREFGEDEIKRRRTAHGRKIIPLARASGCR